jgi:hypothetical protein
MLARYDVPAERRALVTAVEAQRTLHGVRGVWREQACWALVFVVPTGAMQVEVLVGLTVLDAAIDPVGYVLRAITYATKDARG